MLPISLQLMTSDGKLFQVEPALVQQMGTIRHMLMLECCATTEAIPLTRIDSKTLKLLVKWCKYMRDWNDNVDISVRVNILKQLIWSAGNNDQLLYKVINAANYLEMDSLLDAGTQLLANIIHSCGSTEEMRIRFNIQNNEY